MQTHAALTIDPQSCGAPDPSGLAPAALAPITPLGKAPVRRGRGTVVRLRGGMVRKGTAMRHLASEVGQGTVEYVGLLLLMATLLAGVVTASKSLGGNDKIGKQLVEQIGDNIDKAGGTKK